MVRRLIKDLERLRRDCQPFCADFIQDGFIAVCKAHQEFQPKGAGAALDGMDRAKDDIDGFAVVGTVIHDLEAILQGFQQFLAFDEEGGADLCHGIVLFTHLIDPLNLRSSAGP